MKVGKSDKNTLLPKELTADKFHVDYLKKRSMFENYNNKHN
mgnify:CR=1 FL=1